MTTLSTKNNNNKLINSASSHFVNKAPVQKGNGKKLWKTFLFPTPHTPTPSGLSIYCQNIKWHNKKQKWDASSCCSVSCDCSISILQSLQFMYMCMIASWNFSLQPFHRTTQVRDLTCSWWRVTTGSAYCNWTAAAFQEKGPDNNRK